MKQAPATYASEAGSIELIALGFCAALVVLLAIPLFEVLFFEKPSSPVASEPAQSELQTQGRELFLPSQPDR